MTRAQRIARLWFGRRGLRFRVVWYIPGRANVDGLIPFGPGNLIAIEPPYGIEYTRGLRIRPRKMTGTMRVPT